MIKIGIECESIEGDSWGVGKIVYKLLEELSRRPELQREFLFYLYFKSKIPDFPFLDNPIFEKRVTKPFWWPSWIPLSFNIHYHIWMIARAYLDGAKLLFLPNYQLPMLWFKKSIVMLTEDVYYEMNNPNLQFRYRLAYNIFSRWAALWATRIMAISETSRQHVARLFGVKPTRIFTNYLGIDKPMDIPEQNSELGDFILYVGQMFSRRHTKESLEAFEKIAVEFPNLKFIAIGTDKYRPQIINDLIGHINGRLGSERIIRKEYVKEEELLELYKKAKALVYISNKEAFGLPPMEAFSYGTPAIVSDTQLTRELFGDLAFFVPQPTSVDGISKTMRESLTNEERRQRISTNAPHILSQFTWQKFTDRFLEQLNILNKGPGANPGERG